MAGQCTGATVEAAGGGQRHGRETGATGRGGAATGRLGMRQITRERKERAPFYSGGERAGHGRGWNGGGMGGRRPWKVAGNCTAVKGD